MDIALLTKKIIQNRLIFAYILIAILVLTFGIAIESQLNTYAPIKQIAYFKTDAPNQLQVSYNSKPEYKSYQFQSNKFPYYIKSNSANLLTFYEDTFISLKQNTELRTINFQKKRLHLELLSGEILFDNLLASNPVTIQVSDYFLQPYTKGQYVINKNEIVSIVGSSLVGIYHKNSLQKILVLPKGKKITLSDQKISKINSTKFYTDYYINNNLINSVDDLLFKKELFKVSYKGQTIDPLNDPMHANIFDVTLINPNKKSYKDFYGFMQFVRLAETDTANQDQHLKSASEYYLSSIVKNPANIVTYKQRLTPVLEQLLGVHPDNNLYQIKLFLITTFKFNTNSTYLSLLEDLDQSYAIKDPDNINKILNFLTLQSDTENIKKITPKILEILENIAFKYEIAYNIKHFELRAKLGQNLTKPSDKTVFTTNTNLHLQKIKTLAESGDLPNNEIKSLLEFLLKTTSETIQLEYQDLLLKLT